MGRQLIAAAALLAALLACNLPAFTGGGSPGVPTLIGTTSIPTALITTSTTPAANQPALDPARCPTEAPGTGNILQVSPSLGFNGTCYWVEANVVVTLSWPGVPKNATRVEFYYRRANSTLKADTIGVDENLADGASVSWHTYPNIYGVLFALAILPVKSATSDAVNVYSNP